MQDSFFLANRGGIRHISKKQKMQAIWTFMEDPIFRDKIISE
jgi:hypothetical protein